MKIKLRFLIASLLLISSFSQIVSQEDASARQSETELDEDIIYLIDNFLYSSMQINSLFGEESINDADLTDIKLKKLPAATQKLFYNINSRLKPMFELINQDTYEKCIQQMHNQKGCQKIIKRLINIEANEVLKFTLKYIESEESEEN